MNSIITIGNYRNTQYSFINGSRVITINGLDSAIDLSKIKVFANQTQNKMYGAKSYWNNNTIGFNSPSTALTVGTATTGGSVTAGTHQYKVTFVYNTGDESLASVASSQITIVSGTQTVPLTDIPIGSPNVIARNIYRTLAGGTSYKLLTTINDNVTGAFSDTIADASLGVDEPVSTLVYSINLHSSFPVLATGDILDIEIEVPNQQEDDTLGITKVGNLFEPELPPADSEVGAISDTNLSTTTTTYFYEIVQGTWRNLLFQMVASCSGTGGFIKLYRTLDPSAVVPSNGIGVTPSISYWEDCTEKLKAGVNELSVFGPNATHIYKNLSVGPDGQQVDMPDRYLLSWRPTNTSNSITVNIRKF